MFGKGKGWRSLARVGGLFLFFWLLLTFLNMITAQCMCVGVCVLLLLALFCFFIAIECNDQEEGLAYVLRLDGVSK